MKSGAIVSTAARARIPDIDALPFPDREAIDHGLYLNAWKTHHGASSINLITARGCAYKCNWCSHAVYGHSHRRRSPANVADEMQWIIDRYDPDQVWYADDVFTISHPWLASYTAELKRRGIHRPFETITRADRLQNEGAAALLRELGCYRIWIGSESGSQKILDAMQRGVKVEQVRRACRLAHEQGIQVGMFLMWGYEGEEIDDIAATVEHVKQSNPDMFFTTVSYPIKGTGYFDKVRERVELPIAWAEASDRDYVDRRPSRQGLLQARRCLAAQRGRGVPPREPRIQSGLRSLLGTARQAREQMKLRCPAHERRASRTCRLSPPSRRRWSRSPIGSCASSGRQRKRAPDWNDFEWGIARSVCVMHGLAGMLAGRLRWRGPDSWVKFLGEQQRHMRLREARAREILARLTMPRVRVASPSCRSRAPRSSRSACTGMVCAP